MTMTFGETMLALLKERGLSATAVAEELGFKSRTAFFRILHDECRIASVKKCFEAAKASSFLALTPQEIAQLATAVRINEIGRRSYEIGKVLSKMIHPCPESDQPLDDIAVEGMDGVNTLEELLCGFPQGAQIRVAIMGRCEKIILDRLHRLTQEADVREILHFFSIDEEKPYQMVIFSQISSILFSSVYHARMLNTQKALDPRNDFGNGILFFFVDMPLDGRLAVQLIPVQENKMLAIADSSGLLDRFLSRLVSGAMDITEPLKQKSAMDDAPVPDLRTYICFTDEFRKLEHNRAIYMIKPDLPIICIPAEILKPVIVSHVAKILPHSDLPLIDGLYTIHRERIENLYTKKKPTHIILNADAMLRFAQTGKRSDHFFLGREYTPQERVQILEILRDQTRDNPNFSVWFSLREDIVDDKEVTVYENYGVSMVKGDTSWQLHRDHQEIMLKNRVLAEEFKSTFLKSLLYDEVMSREESIAMLERLIDVAKQSELSTES